MNDSKIIYVKSDEDSFRVDQFISSFKSFDKDMTYLQYLFENQKKIK